ncbi:MAG TPA: S9 family peptidase [Allosphingosinicella sp.]|nr:S9 family peptidase [Allosphingosinicella sp.]
MAGVALALGSAVATAAVTSPPPKIPAEAFGELSFIQNPKISPDGHYVVALSVMDKKKALVLADLSIPDYGLRTIGIPDNSEILACRWAGSRRILITLLVPQRLDGYDIHVIRLFMFDMDTKAVKALGDRVGGFNGGDIIYVDPNGAYLLLAAAPTLFDAPAVLRVDLATGQAQGVLGPHDGIWDWAADPKGVVRAGFGFDKGQFVLYYRNTADGPFRKIARWLDEAHQTMTDVETVLPSSDGDKGYVIANKATGRFGLYRYDLSTGAIGEPIYENPDVDIMQNGLGLSDSGELMSVDYIDTRRHTFWIDPAMKAVQARLDKAMPDKVNDIVSIDAAEHFMVVSSSSGSDPGSFYIFDRAKGELREFARPFSRLDGAILAPVQPVRYAARDGLSIPAYLTLPVGRDLKALPLIVIPHGGPFLRDDGHYDPWVQFLANRGYAVLQPNYRGSTGYGKAYVDAATGEWGRKMQDDLDDGVHWLVAQGRVDPKRVCIMGGSYGGYAAMWAAVRNPDIYRCAISLAGISDMPAMMHHDASVMTATRYIRDWRDRIRTKGQDMASVSALPHVAEIRIPILIAHGKDDDTVLDSQSIRLHEAMDKAGKPNEFVLYPGEGHAFSKEADSVDFLKRVDAFLAKYNPAG